MDDIKEELEQIKRILITKFNPLAIILFGSYSRNSQREDSDIDIAMIANETSKNELFVVKSSLEEQVKRFYDNLPEHIIIVSKELRMYHKKYQYAGTADLILYNTLTGNIIIADFKTNEDLYKSFNNLVSPFEFLPDTAFNKYQLQLNYYQLMLEQTGLEVESRVIIWLKENEYKEIYCNDFRTELLECLNKN